MLGLLGRASSCWGLDVKQKSFRRLGAAISAPLAVLLLAGAAYASPGCDAANRSWTNTTTNSGFALGTFTRGEKILFQVNYFDPSASGTNAAVAYLDLDGSHYQQVSGQYPSIPSTLTYTIQPSDEGHVFSESYNGQSAIGVVLRCISVSSVSPASVAPGSSVTITGSGFYQRTQTGSSVSSNSGDDLTSNNNYTAAPSPAPTPVTSVTFGGVPAASFTVNAPTLTQYQAGAVTTITAIAPTGVPSSGSVVVSYGSLSNASNSNSAFTLVVPTLSEWAFGLMTLIMAGLGTVFLNRRMKLASDTSSGLA